MNKLQKKYWGVLRYSYTQKDGKDVRTLKETYGECCCYEPSTKLYTTKKEAKEDMHDNEIPDILVEFTTKIVKK